ncbi:hypothetical protein BGZ94_006385 [Podila epigama]|nr:hypothetical protein BGZ94_006385 [Podila epigama]
MCCQALSKRPGQQVKIQAFHLRYRWPKKEDSMEKMASSSSSFPEPGPSSIFSESGPSFDPFTSEDAGLSASMDVTNSDELLFNSSYLTASLNCFSASHRCSLVVL